MSTYHLYNSIKERSENKMKSGITVRVQEASEIFNNAVKNLHHDKSLLLQKTVYFFFMEYYGGDDKIQSGFFGAYPDNEKLGIFIPCSDKIPVILYQMIYYITEDFMRI